MVSAAQTSDSRAGFGLAFDTGTEVFDVDAEALEEAIFSHEEDEKMMIELAEAFLRKRLPERDDNVAEARRIVEYIKADRGRSPEWTMSSAGRRKRSGEGRCWLRRAL